MYSEVSRSIFYTFLNPYGCVGFTNILLCVFTAVDSFRLLTTCNFFYYSQVHILNFNLMVLYYSVLKLPVDGIRCRNM
jgi:hypothetical protein